MSSNQTRSRRVGLILACAALLPLGGCQALALTAVGIGASTGVSHTLGGITYRTFTLPVSKVKGATMTALNRMAIKVESSEKMEGGEVIKARSSDREIEIELEAVSPTVTRMRAVAKKGPLIYDSATAMEIIYQTERLLNA